MHFQRQVGWRWSIRSRNQSAQWQRVKCLVLDSEWENPVAGVEQNALLEFFSGEFGEGRQALKIPRGHARGGLHLHACDAPIVPLDHEVDLALAPVSKVMQGDRLSGPGGGLAQF